MQPVTGSVTGKVTSRNGEFHHKEDRVSGLTHGDDFVLTEPTEKCMEFERKMMCVYPIKAKTIGFGSPKSIKTLNRRLHRRKREIVYQHDPRHVDVLVKDLGLEHGNSVQTPATPDVTEEEESEPLSQDQHHRSQVTSRQMLVPQSRSSRHNIHRERVVPKDVESQSTEPCQAEEACQVLETRETEGTGVRIWSNEKRPDGVHGFGLGWLQGYSEVIKCRRADARKTHTEGIHA